MWKTRSSSEMSLFQSAFARNRTLPWRVRNWGEKIVEEKVRTAWPSVYRLLHIGQMRDVVVPLSRGPEHHFFGYYDKSPWNPSQKLVLAHQVRFNDRPPVDEDVAQIGVIESGQSNRFHGITTTFAWNWQQGAMLQWDPRAPERRFLVNKREAGKYVCVVYDVIEGKVGDYSRPIYAVDRKGEYAYSLNFSRLADHRPGYGYAGVPDPYRSILAPEKDGIWRINMATGRSDLVVTLRELAEKQKTPTMAGAYHYVNHIQVSKGGRWVAFFHIWTIDGMHWEVRMYICRADGSELRCVLNSGSISHYDWAGDDAILVWARHPTRKELRFLKVDLAADVESFAGNILVEDGHCSFSPDGTWVLNDTYPDRFEMRTLMIVGWRAPEKRIIARLYSPKEKWWGEIRCDLHPRWSPDGRSVCIDSVHE